VELLRAQGELVIALLASRGMFLEERVVEERVVEERVVEERVVTQ
jgi:hypothetical protein